MSLDLEVLRWAWILRQTAQVLVLVPEYGPVGQIISILSGVGCQHPLCDLFYFYDQHRQQHPGDTGSAWVQDPGYGEDIRKNAFSPLVPTCSSERSGEFCTVFKVHRVTRSVLVHT